MPSIPKTTGNFSASNAEAINLMRDMSTTFASSVPLASGDAIQMREIGQIVTEFQATRNEFVNLINRIALTVATGRPYRNPWARFKRGLLEFGETVEEYFVNIANAHDFDPTTAESEVFKREIPDVRPAFHIRNFQKLYKQTVSREELRAAFLNSRGIEQLVNMITGRMVDAMNTDELLVMRYMISRMALDGNIVPYTIPELIKANAEDIVISVKTISNELEKMGTDYNISQVFTHTPKRNQILLVSSDFDAINSVAVMAQAFNIPYVDFTGQWVLAYSFTFNAQETARLENLLGLDEVFTSTETTKLDTLGAVMVDEEFFMIFDNLIDMENIYNPQGLYWNYVLHAWKTFSASPYANAVALTSSTAAVTAVAVTPETVTVSKGQSVQFDAQVTSTGFASNQVTWKVTGGVAGTAISPSGLLYVDPAETAATLTVTAISVQTNTVNDTATVSVSGNL